MVAAYTPADWHVSALKKYLRYPERTKHCSGPLLRLADMCRIWTDEQTLQIPDKLSSWKNLGLRKPCLISAYTLFSPS